MARKSKAKTVTATEPTPTPETVDLREANAHLAALIAELDAVPDDAYTTAALRHLRHAQGVLGDRARRLGQPR